MNRAFVGPGRLALPPQGGLLLVRHAERHPILIPSMAYTAGLTGKGLAAARAFGEQLGQGWEFEAAAASPVPRCLDTARQILEGALNGSRPHPLVQPLPILHFDQSLTGIPGLRNVFLNDPNFTALASSPQRAEYALLRDTLLVNLPFPTRPGVLTLAVSHDVVVSFLWASVLGLEKASPENFPGYLEGICLVREGGKVRVWDPAK